MAIDYAQIINNVDLDYIQLDPRPTEAARQKNAQAFAPGRTVGIEVTLPQYAALCSINIDPQHDVTHRGYADACSAARWIYENLKNFRSTLINASTLVTVRPDVDSIAAMAIITATQDAACDSSIDFTLAFEERLHAIDKMDCFANGPWQEQGNLPCSMNSWPDEDRAITALGAMCADFRVPMDQRVQSMMAYLFEGIIPEVYLQQVHAERLAMIAALNAGEIRIEVVMNDGHAVAVVHSRHRFGTTLGYRLAPVVVAINDQFTINGGEPHRKVTICQWQEGYINLEAVAAALDAKAEGIKVGWGGSRTIIGSPQGVDTQVSEAEILAAIEANRIS
jgi:hypothetical protein